MKVLMDEDLLDLYVTGKYRRYLAVSRNRELNEGFRIAVEAMINVSEVTELKNISFLHYEKLKHQLSGFSSVRLSNRYVHRLIFREADNSEEIELIEIDDTHYGNK